MDNKRLRAEYDLLSDKLHPLRMALIREYDASVKFKLEKDIEDVEAERLFVRRQALFDLSHVESQSTVQPCCQIPVTLLP